LRVLHFVLVQGRGDGSKDFVGKVRIVDGARDNEGTDEARVGGKRLLTSPTAGAALNDAAQVLEERAELVSEGAANRVALPCDLWTEGCHGATATGTVTMFRGEVGGCEGFERIAS
jgi:hypothetical protein